MKVGAVIGAGVAGMFVGALVMDIIHRHPDLMKNFGEKTKETFSMFAEAFKEGYHGEGAKKKAS